MTKRSCRLILPTLVAFVLGILLTGCGATVTTTSTQSTTVNQNTQGTGSTGTARQVPYAPTTGGPEQTRDAVGTGDSEDGSYPYGTVSGDDGTGGVLAQGPAAPGNSGTGSSGTGTGGGGSTGSGSNPSSDGTGPGTGGSGVTAADLENKYRGVKIVNEPKAWTAQELAWLDDVLSKMPAGAYEGTELVRTSVIEVDGVRDPNIFGVSRTGDGRRIVEISDHSISDNASDRIDFPTPPYDTDSSKSLQFRATIAHELTHNYMRYNPGGKYYADWAEHPWVAGENGWASKFGWSFNPSSQQWQLDPSRSGEAPSKYARTENPAEDMAESVMFYLYDPDRLKASSPERYDFIKSQMGI